MLLLLVSTGVTARAGAGAEPAAPPAPAADPDLQRCRLLGDARERLACYDQWANAAPAAVTQSVPPAPAAAAAGSARAAAAPALQPAEQMALVGERGLWSSYWELEGADKHGTFNVKTYRINYLLPLRWSSYINQTPSTPTQPGAPGGPRYLNSEAKMQVSLRTKLIQDFGLPDGDLWFGYTQQSQWQIWNRSESSPFRNTDYEAELVYVAPVPARWQGLPFGWRWTLAQAGLSHQSNGQVNGLSRSWNRIYLGAGVERGPWSLYLRQLARIPERKPVDDNPDIARRIGRTDISLAWLPGRATAQLQWRPSLSRAGGSVEFNATYPIRAEQPQGLRWYLQWFNGYGESLIDYNVRQQSLGLGLGLFEF
ncbi:MAG: phospholipase A [Burkholderiales bacterium]